ncbi:MAG TPA: phage tail protein [Thiotrichales bacterium]|nr:phage tail protein [Thiotrichales bacterium]
MSNLLPANATDLERAIVLATDFSVCISAIDAIANRKTNPNEALIPWLIWEYGLGELLPYLTDPRRAISEGVLWQRSRGTPAALLTALGWIGLSAQIEQEVPGVHFAQFQIDAGAVPDDTTLTALIGIAKLSAPARSRLARVFNQGWDIRRVMLDDSRLGDALLSDYSGVMHRDGQTRLSFGRLRQLAQPSLSAGVLLNRQANRVSFTRLIDKLILDFSRLGDDQDTPNHKIIHSHLFTKSNNDALCNPSGFLPQRQFCKAMLVLGEGIIGDTNACTPRRRLIETGQPLRLSAGDPLSATAHQLTTIEVLERLDLRHHGAQMRPLLVHTFINRDSQHSKRLTHEPELRLGELVLSADRPTRDHHARHSEHHRHNKPVAESVTLEMPRFFVKAQQVLGERTPLGTINSRTIKTGWFRTKPVPTLGSFALGDRAEIEQRVITACSAQTTQLATPIALTLGVALTSKETLSSQSLNVKLAVAVNASNDATNSSDAAYLGQTWAGVKWVDARWSSLREVVGVGQVTNA